MNIQTIGDPTINLWHMFYAGNYCAMPKDPYRKADPVLIGVIIIAIIAAIVVTYIVTR